MLDRFGKFSRTPLWTALLLAGLSACDGSETEVISVENAGGLDISASSDTLRVRVDFEQCLSSSCDEVQSATCSASITDDRIVVTSQLVYTSATGERACTDDCQS